MEILYFEKSIDFFGKNNGEFCWWLKGFYRVDVVFLAGFDCSFSIYLSRYRK